MFTCISYIEFGSVSVSSVSAYLYRHKKNRSSLGIIHWRPKDGRKSSGTSTKSGKTHIMFARYSFSTPFCILFPSVSMATANAIHDAGAFVLSSYRKIRENEEGEVFCKKYSSWRTQVNTGAERVPAAFFLSSPSVVAKWACSLSWPHGTRAPVVIADER